ncbi:sensor histidine kinase [Streptosporangium sp. NPDC087985]|uniref:sensor histidine kinase n=1 Tax=Streptosporangium sp. NPDC087985 TaxID=3366196 RepID=UPI00382D7395
MSRFPIPRRARGIVVVVLTAFMTVYLLAMPLGSVMGVPVLGLQLVWVVPSLRRFRGIPLLAVQACAGYAAVLCYDTSVGILGFLAGSLLLSRLWTLAPVVAISAAVIDSVRQGDVSDTANVTISMVLSSLVIYGLTRLTERVDEVHATRLALAMAAVAEERLRIAAELNDGLGHGLTVITQGTELALAEPPRTAEVIGEVVITARAALADARTASAGYRAMSLAPEITTARAMLSSAGVAAEVRLGHTEPLGLAGALLATVLRESVTEIVRRGTARTCVIETEEADGRMSLRVTDDGARTAADDGLGGLPRQVSDAGGVLTTGLTPAGHHTVTVTLPVHPETRPAPVPPPGGRVGARGWPALLHGDQAAYTVSVAVLASVVMGFSVKALLYVPGNVVPAVVCLAVIVVMQLRSVTGRHMWALTLMTLLTYLPVLAFGRAWLGVAGFLAGPILLAFPAPIAWPLVACVMTSVAVIGSVLGLPLPDTVNFTVSTLVTGLVVYGLVRLAQLVKELQNAREELARSAVLEERLRAARDLHDLLGHSLAAILLKCELARRLDPERARAELLDVLAMTAQAEADLRAVSGEHRDLSLTAEAESARSVLTAAGIEVSLGLAHGALPAEVETALSAVLREAVTNILRHSAARRCVIETLPESGGVRLRVRNDGVRSPEGRRGSSGIGNLTTRLTSLGGLMSVGAENGWFELDAHVPHGSLGEPGTPARRSGAEVTR